MRVAPIPKLFRRDVSPGLTLKDKTLYRTLSLPKLRGAGQIRPSQIRDHPPDTRSVLAALEGLVDMAQT